MKNLRVYTQKLMLVEISMLLSSSGKLATFILAT